VTLPPGYRYAVLHATGDALRPSVSPYSNAGLEADDWSMRVGDHHDGMDLYFIDEKGRYTERDTGRAVLAVNHESSADAFFMHPNGQTSNGVSGKKFTQFGDWDLGTRPAAEVLKEINHHGVSMVEIVKTPQGWRIKPDSPLNRRVTAQTPVRVAGPRAHIDAIRAQMVTRWDTAGGMARGTLNNCGHGKTPWGTYLGCEENWAFYFGMTAGGAAPALWRGQRTARCDCPADDQPGLAHGFRHRRPLLALEPRGARPQRRGRLPQRGQHLRLQRRDRPAGSQRHARQARDHGPFRARSRRVQPA
jgi:secreted PhoX family phosphatase